MLGEQGTEQFEVRTEVDEREIGRQKIHDPFITNTTVIRPSRFDLLKLLLARVPELRVRVKVSATEGAMRAIMMLCPTELAKESALIASERQQSRNDSVMRSMGEAEFSVAR